MLGYRIVSYLHFWPRVLNCQWQYSKLNFVMPSFTWLLKKQKKNKVRISNFHGWQPFPAILAQNSLPFSLTFCVCVVLSFLVNKNKKKNFFNEFKFNVMLFIQDQKLKWCFIVRILLKELASIKKKSTGDWKKKKKKR